MIIDMDTANHLVLHKQHLTEESRIDNIVQIVKDIGGLHTTSSIGPYLPLFSRTRNFIKEDLDKEL